MSPLKDLTEVLQNSWDGQTSRAGKKWNENNPSLGHCAVSALVLNDFLGGEIRRAVVYAPNGTELDSHYYNTINDKQVDITADQFQPGDFIDYAQSTEADREKMLKNANTKKRYTLLRERVDEVVEAEA